MARRRRQMTAANLKEVVEEYLNHLGMQRDVNPNSIFFLNGLTKWVSKRGDFQPEQLGSILTTLIREGKLELNLSPGIGLHFGKPNR